MCGVHRMPEVPEGNLPKPVSEKTPAPAAAAPPPVSKPAPAPWECTMVDSLQSTYGAGILEAATSLGQHYLVLDRSVCHAVISALRLQFGYASLTDITAVHYPKDALPF